MILFFSSALEHLKYDPILSTLIGFGRTCKGTVQIDVPNENKVTSVARKVFSILGFYKRPEAEGYELCDHSRFLVKDLKKLGFSVYGLLDG